MNCLAAYNGSDILIYLPNFAKRNLRFVVTQGRTWLFRTLRRTVFGTEKSRKAKIFEVKGTAYLFTNCPTEAVT